ncbi:hypothetical protein VE03_08572 [Pseudogymnoascus sp. 23342-1-I1]|nr:hypothetical protein VE03_08572 [Pseudogymnoascus sp. 23342-1-I1]
MAPPRRSKRDMRKVQTRLSFEPNATSPSRASSGISPARIVYQDPRNPKKKQQPSSSANKNEPVPSSSARSIPYFSDDEDIFADGKKFAVVLPSPSRSAATGQARGRSFMGAASSSVKQRGRPRKSVAYESDSESEEEIRAPTPTEKKRKTPILVEDDNESDEEDIIAPAERTKKTPILLEDESDSSDEDEVATPADKRRKRSDFLKNRSESPLKSPTRAIVKNGSVETPRKPSEESPSPKRQKSTPIRSFIAGGYLDPAPSPRSAKNQRDPAKKDKPVSRRSKSKEIVAISSDEESDSDGIVVEQPSIRKKKADSGRKEKVLPSRKRRRSTTSEEDDEPVRSSPTKRRKQVLHEDTSSSSSSSPVISSRRLAATPRKPQPTLPTKPSEAKNGKQGKDKDELTRQTRQMNTPKKHRTEKQKKLELLKRRRAGEKITELTESSSDEYQDERGAYDSDASHAALSVFDDEESEEGALEKVRQSLRPSNRNLDDDSFIVSDSDTPLGAPLDSLHEIPLEFTHHAHKHLKEHFKDAIEWMVQKKINPAFNQRDAIYMQAFRKLEPEARGLAQSKFSSAAWTEGFTRALWGRPLFHEEELGGEGEGRKCDACGRSGHPAKFRVRLMGKPYYQDTLEDVENSDEESDDEDDDDAASVNSKGQKLLSADTEFYLGRFCRANAERAHSLIHWKHALYEWVVQTLSDQGFLDAEKLAERVRWGERKLGQLANGIVDEWTEGGEIKGLYRDFRNNLEAARNNRQDRWNA